ncbi:MAG TPA: LacI family DNA-binding transcriptional regulator, partial [Clostridia bacterium]|nr:LacI family DNA-binding transcriptional regulator [Clostridia bacterium]
MAKQAGVSTATVSRVINGAHNVDAALRQKVRQTMREMGYVPNSIAQSLRQNR